MDPSYLVDPATGLDRRTAAYPDPASGLPTGRSVTHSWDQRGRLGFVADGALHLADFGYDLADRLISAALNNGVASGYDYDAADRLTGLSHLKTGGPTLFDKSFAYDAAGNRLWSRDNLAGADNRSELYRYDGLHRLTRFERGELGPNNDQIVAPPSADHLASQTWPTPGGLDKRGNWLSHDWSVQRDPSPESHTEARTRNGVNEYLTRQRDAEPAVNLVHDAAGNLIDDGRFTYTYDAENRLATVHDGPVELLAVTYDALGRAVERTTQQGIIRYVYDAPSGRGPNGYAVVAEYDGAGTLLREFVHAAGHTRPLVLIDYTSAGSLPAGSAETFYYLLDERGSVAAITDEAGAVVESYRYDAYGGAYVYDGSGALTASWLDNWDDASLTPSAVGNPYGFTGHRFSVAGLYEAPFRAYSPSLGRWLQRDPLGYIDGVNLYEYVASEPTGLLDPLGLVIKIGGSPEHKQKIRKFLEKLAELDPRYKAILQELEDSPREHVINTGSENITVPRPKDAKPGEPAGSNITWNMADDKDPEDSSKKIDPIVNLAHELSHSYDFDRGADDSNDTDDNGVKKGEARAVRNENIIRRILGLFLRKTYGGKKVEDHDPGPPSKDDDDKPSTQPGQDGRDAGDDCE